MKSKKCVWEDGRFPYTFDFANGDGEAVVNEKYVKDARECFNSNKYFGRIVRQTLPAKKTTSKRIRTKYCIHTMQMRISQH